MRQHSIRALSSFMICMLISVFSGFGQIYPVNCSTPAGCNLVANPGFETMSACPTSLNSQPILACNWADYEGGEAYYFNSCANAADPSRGVPNNHYNCYGSLGGNPAHGGNGYMGIIPFVSGLYGGAMYSRKIYQQLNAPLVNGRKYYVEMFASPSECWGTGIKELGILFTASNPQTLPVSNMTPQVESPVVVGPGWNRIGGCFNSNGTERFLSIGCFRNNASLVTTGTVNNNGGGGGVFYYLDDVFLAEFPRAGNGTTIVCGNSYPLGTACSGNTPFTFSWTAAPADPSLTGQTNAPNPVVSPKVSTTYTLTVTAPNGCTQVTNTTVSVSSGAYISATASPSNINCGSTTQLNVTGIPAASTFVWRAVPADPSLVNNLSNPVVRPLVTTTYDVVATSPNGCQAYSNTIKVTVIPLEVKANALPSLLCTPGQQSQLGVTNVPPGSIILWTASPADPSLNASNNTLANLTVTPSVTTVYTVKVTTPQGCIDTKTLTVTVAYFTPLASANPATITCTGTSVISVTGAPAGSVYNWSDGAGFNSTTTTSSIAVSPLQTSTYTVVVTRPGGCSRSVSQTVIVNSGISVPVITGGTLVCPENPIQLCTNYTAACPSLVSGDVVIISYGRGTNRRLTMMALRNIPSCVTLSFTNQMWNGSGFSGAGSNFSFTSPGLAAGQIFSITGPVISFNPGDQNRIYVYQSAPGPIRLLHGLGFRGNNLPGLVNSTVFLGGIVNAMRAPDVSAPGMTKNAYLAVVSASANWIGSSIVPAGNANITDNPSVGLRWNTTATSSCIPVTTAGTYSVTYTDIHGCNATASQTVNDVPVVTNTITGANPVCKNVQNVPYSITTTVAGSTVEWSLPSGVSFHAGSSTNTASISLDFTNFSGGILSAREWAGGCPVSSATLTLSSTCCAVPLTATCTGNTYAYSGDFPIFYAFGMAIDDNDNIYIANTSSSSIDVYTTSNSYVTSFPGFNLPLGVAVDKNGYVFVANHLAKSIAKMSPAGLIVNSWPILNTVGEQMYPQHVAVDHCGDVYATVTHGYWVTQFDNNGNFIRNIDTRLAGESTLLTQHLTGVAVDGMKNVFVADMTNKKIKKFDANGNYVTHWNMLENVYELAVDEGGNVYATEMLGGISKYSNNGALLVNFTASTGWSAVGVDIDSDCNVWTSENNVIRKFEYTSSLPKKGVSTMPAEAAEAFTAYPNPSSGNITIAFDANATYELVIYNSVGIETLRTTVIGDSYEIEDRLLTPGLYTIKVSGSRFKNKMIKVVKN